MFDIEKAIGAWRRSFSYNRVFFREDLDELEEHLRDHVEALRDAGWQEEAAFRTALDELGDYGHTEQEYRKVFWAKLKHRRGVLRELTWHAAMLKNYLLLTVRTLRKHKGYAAINVFGLTVGIAAALLLLLYMRHELSYDTFHEHASSTYRLGEHLTRGSQTDVFYLTRTPALPALLADYPEVVNGTRVLGWQHWLSTTDAAFPQRVTYVDSGFFDVFSFAVLRGDGPLALRTKDAVLLTEETARRYFGETDPVGQVLDMDAGARTLMVMGVVADPPLTSSLQFEILAPWLDVPAFFASEQAGNWYNSNMPTYIRLNERTTPEAFTDQLQTFKEQYFTRYEGVTVELLLMPLLAYHAETTNNEGLLYLLACIAGVILLIASINYTNLSTAHSLRRVHEIGVRKVLGADRRRIMGQFLGESLLTCFFALVAGVALAIVLLPWFNDLVGISLALPALSHPATLLILLGLGLGVGVLAGSYPAFFLSGFLPIQALQRKLRKSRSRSALQHALIVVQFGLSIVLIVGTLVIWQQIAYMKNADPAFDEENVVVVPLSGFENRDAALRHLTTIRDELLRDSRIRTASFSQGVPSNYQYNYNSFYPAGHESSDPIRLRQSGVDAHYFDTYGIRLVEGRMFSEERAADRQAIIINERALEVMGWTSGGGKTIRAGGSGGRALEVIGVVEDFFYQSLQHEIEPLIHYYYGPDAQRYNYLSVAVRAGHVPEVVDHLRGQWSRLNTSRDFDFFFIDEQFDALYRTQERTGLIVGTFSSLAILIACLGLLGLAMFATQRRTKEIGIRKVLGATVPRLALLLSKEFIRLVVVAFVVAVPVAYLLLDRWLQDFAYRIEISWSIFLLAGSLSLAIALLTVSYQSIKAAATNPVKTLRYE